MRNQISIHPSLSICLVILVLLVVSCSGGMNEELVYLKSKDGNFDLYQSDALGQWEKRLTTNEGWDWQAKWNPTLGSIVYYSYDSAGKFSVISQTLGGAKTALPFSELVNFQLTPDAEKIIFIERDSITSNIWRCNRDGTDREPLTETNGYNGRVAIHPEGQLIAFISDRTGTNELFSLDLISRELNQLTENDQIEKYLTWSPDGQKIALTMKPNEEAKEDVFIINADGTDLEQVTFTPYAEQEIAWSLSGDKIAFHGTSESDGDQIYTINLKDGSFVKVTSGDYYHGEPCWIPVN